MCVRTHPFACVCACTCWVLLLVLWSLCGSGRANGRVISTSHCVFVCMWLLFICKWKKEIICQSVWEAVFDYLNYSPQSAQIPSFSQVIFLATMTYTVHIPTCVNKALEATPDNFFAHRNTIMNHHNKIYPFTKPTLKTEKLVNLYVFSRCFVVQTGQWINISIFSGIMMLIHVMG